MSGRPARSMPEQLLRGVVTALLGAVLAGCGAAETPGASDPGTQGPGPNDPEAQMHPDLLDLSASSATPGETIEVRFPEETLRGIAWVLEEQDGDTWHARYYLSAVTDGHDAASPSWWSVDDSEGRGWEDIGVEGPGPDALVIPDSIRPGAYRLCTANSIQNICAALDIVD